MTPTFFKTPAAFRAWLQKHHRTATELWVGYCKKNTGHPTITWQESVDEALCFGWIDGIRKSVDAESYTNRFTPRRAGSVWSAINTRRAAELIEGRTDARRPDARRTRRGTPREPPRHHSVRENPRLDRVRAAEFKANRAAWEFFQAQPPGYRRLAIWWVVSAKREETRARRFEQLIGSPVRPPAGTMRSVDEDCLNYLRFLYRSLTRTPSPSEPLCVGSGAILDTAPRRGAPTLIYLERNRHMRALTFVLTLSLVALAGGAAVAQEGHPLKGSWIGTWSATSRTARTCCSCSTGTARPSPA